ncbi:hypothetical protein BDZ91DRAFT_851764 [Kalaharituber pfeilii]|nr:hypothetical protein BDZ91DRAFT_851764 [Kalaharituber pfeilii]
MAPIIPDPGDILWLRSGQTIDGVDPGQLEHPVVVVGGVKKGKIVICGITSFGNTPLETKFRDPKIRFKFLPLYFDPPDPLIDNDREGRSYVDASRPVRVPTTALSPLAYGTAVLDPDAFLQLRREILIRQPEWKGKLGPVKTKSKKQKRTSARKQGPSLAATSHASRPNLASPTSVPLASESYASRSNFAPPTAPSLASASHASRLNLTSPIGPSLATPSHASRSNFAPPTAPSLASASHASRLNLTSPIGPSLATPSHASRSNLAPPVAPRVPVLNSPRVGTPAPQSSRTYYSTPTHTPRPASASTFNTHRLADEGRARIVDYRPISQPLPRSSNNRHYIRDLENGPMPEYEEERGWSLGGVLVTIATLGVGIYATIRYLMGRG